MKNAKASAEYMVGKIIDELDFEPSPSAIDRAVTHVEGILTKSGNLFRVVSDPERMDRIRGKVMEILGGRTRGNPMSSRKENYNDFDEWETDVFRAGATQVVRLGEDLFSAIKMKDGSLVKLDEEGFVDMRSRAGQKVRKESITVGAWYGDRGEIYRQTIKNNPVRQRIGISLSKNRKRNPLESGATISDDEDINARASNMG